MSSIFDTPSYGFPTSNLENISSFHPQQILQGLSFPSNAYSLFRPIQASNLSGAQTISPCFLQSNINPYRASLEVAVNPNQLFPPSSSGIFQSFITQQPQITSQVSLMNENKQLNNTNTPLILSSQFSQNNSSSNEQLENQRSQTLIKQQIFTNIQTTNQFPSTYYAPNFINNAQNDNKPLILPRFQSDPIGIFRDEENSEVGLAINGSKGRLKRKAHSSAYSHACRQFVEEYGFPQSYLKSNVSSSTSLICSFRNRQQGDKQITLSFSNGSLFGPRFDTQFGTGSHEYHPSQEMIEEQDSICSQKRPSSIQNGLDCELEDKNDSSQTDSIQEENSSLIALSNYKKKLMSSLSAQDQEIINLMKTAKKFNFSKNVIKQFQKVILKVSYIYEKDATQKGKYKLKKDPSLQKLLEFRSELSKFIAASSYKHSAIKRIASHPQFSLYFRDFLFDHSEEWLVIGKTKYKKEQRIMLSYLQICMRNPKLLIFLSEHEHCSKRMQ